jgi:hypothetical protein
MQIETGLRGRAYILRALLVTIALLQARPLHAQGENQATARQHFEKGYRLVERGALDAAIKEFEQAYRLSPHFSVLYNLGQAYATLGRSVGAVERLERYLELGAAQINEVRARQVRELIAYHAQRIGSLTLDVRPAGARVTIDGTALEASASSGPVRLNPGVHGVVVEHPNYATAAASVHIDAGQTARVSLELEPLPAVRVAVTCAIPDVVVALDGVPAAVSAGSILVPAGAHRLEFRRAGYVTREQTIRAEPGATYDCALAQDPLATNVATLRVRHPSGTVALLDGAPLRAGPLPEGRHRVSVKGARFESAEKLVMLAPHRTYTVDLMPSRSSAVLLAEQSQRERTRKVAGLVVGGAGVAAAAVAGGLFLYNSSEYDDWRSEAAGVIARFHADPASVSARELDELFDEQSRIHNRDAVAAGVGVFGLVSLAAASVLLLWPTSAPDVVTITGSVPSSRLRF